MKLYRFTGRRELFPECGKVYVSNTVSGNLTELKKFALKWRAKTRKEGLEYKVYIESIRIETISQALLVQLLTEEDTELLVKNRLRLKEWEWNRDDTE